MRTHYEGKVNLGKTYRAPHSKLDPALVPATEAEPLTRALEVDATEAAVRLAAENGVDLSTVTGTGSGGRITQADVEQAIG